MSFLSDIKTYWTNNTTLNAVLSVSNVWLGVAPETAFQNFPYAIITSVMLSPTFTTGNPHYATFTFQINVYHTDPEALETLAAGIAAQFDWKTIASSCMACIRTNGPVMFVDTDTPQRVYHVLLEWQLMENKTVPNT